MRRQMGDELRDLLQAMSLVAHDEAHKHLSEAGREVLEMMEYTSRNSGLSIADAYMEASATASLSERDKDIIKAYLAGCCASRPRAASARATSTTGLGAETPYPHRVFRAHRVVCPLGHHRRGIGRWWR
jgi:hypothetical protein